MIKTIEFTTFVDAYWKYYITLEKRLIRTEEYVAFDEFNNNAYSIEFLSLLQIICSEIDVLAKAIVTFYDSEFKAKNAGIHKWGFELQQHFPELTDQNIIFRESRTFVPWAGWKIEKVADKNGRLYYKYAEGQKSPAWWNAYNKVKHARTTIEKENINYRNANQKNVLLALSALFLLNRFMMKELNPKGYPTIEKSSIFAVYGWNDEMTESLLVNDNGSVTMIVKSPW